MSTDLDTEGLLLKLRELLSDILPSLRNDFLRSDPVLVKFLIAQGYNLRKAEEMLHKCLEWRRANNVDTILERPFCHELDPYHEVHLPGFDKLGQPIFISQVGQWDMFALLQSLAKTNQGPTILVQYVEKASEVCRMISQSGKTIAKSFLIVDCADFDYKLLANPQAVNMGLSLLRESCHIALNYYPECVYKVVLVNVMPMFQLVWTLIKPMLPRATLANVAIYGTNANSWKKYLLEHIDPDVLPSQYGGADTSGLLDCRFEVDKDFIPRSDLVLLPPENLLQHYVEPRRSFSVEMATKPGDRIVWNFRTETQDIGFQVECHNGGVIIHQCRVDAHKFTQKGRLRCLSKATKYTFTWDNSHSYVTGKNLFYAVKIQKISYD